MKKPVWIISLLVLLLTGVVSWFWLTTYHRVSHERELPMQGEARYNPLYALQLSLRAMGQVADTHARLDWNNLKLKPNDTLVLYSPPNGMSEGQIDQMLKWVGGGGHIIVSVPDKSFLNDKLTLFTKLGITPSEVEAECFHFLAEHEKTQGAVCGTLFLTEDPENYLWLHGDAKKGYSLGKTSWGNGSIVIASSLSFMNNQNLKDNSSRQLSYQLLASSINKGRFHLVYATDMPPLWLLLLRYGWTLLVPAFTLLLAWLLYRGQRFGPLQASPNPDRRALLEHITATGEYMFRRHLGHELHLAVLAMFKARLRRRDPMTAALTGDAQIQALAERTKIDPQKIRQAFQPGSLRQKENFFHSIATLIALRNQL
jgi:hypothetical protein